MYRRIETTSDLIPILNQEIELGFLYFFLIFIMFTAESNAVNLTDGLMGYVPAVQSSLWHHSFYLPFVRINR